jgi:DNA (cytosine-5)-methyltransferase 1
MTRPLLLDLFCGEGGASAGYHAAGFDVVGVDLAAQPRYPYEFHRGDALQVLDAMIRTGYVRRFAAIAASPPCQTHSALRHSNAHRYADLIPATRELLIDCGLPYVIENVEGAPLKDPVTLCGSMFGLGTQAYGLRRHRLFETSFPVLQPVCAHDGRPVIGVYGGKTRLRIRTPHWGTNLPKSDGQEALRIDWMTINGMSQAVPPAYTEHVGRALSVHLNETI